MDYFKILGIKPDASEKEIKTAFRKMAMKWHPDKNPNNEDAAEKFRKINEAYEFLMAHPGYKPYEKTSNNSKSSTSNSNSKNHSNSNSRNYNTNKKNTTSGNRTKATGNSSYTRQAKYYSTSNTNNSRKKSYKDPNFDDEEESKQYSKPEFNTKPSGSYMNENNYNSEMNPFAKGCLITIVILLIPIMFFTCVLGL